MFIFPLFKVLLNCMTNSVIDFLLTLALNTGETFRDTVCFLFLPARRDVYRLSVKRDILGTSGGKLLETMPLTFSADVKVAAKTWCHRSTLTEA